MMSIYLVFGLWGAGATETNISASTLGEKMMVEHVRFGAGREVLRVRQVAVEGDRQIVELNLSKDEVLANEYGFRCENNRGDVLYAVISKRHAQETEIFPAERAWFANVDRVKFERVKITGQVKCYFAPDGETSYPFK